MTAKDDCAWLVRLLLAGVNLILLLFGMCTISVGVTALNRHDDIDFVTGSRVFTAGGILMGNGVAVILFALWGLVASSWKNKTFLGVFMFCMSILIILEFTLGVLCFAGRNKINERAGDKMLSHIGLYRQPNDSSYNAGNNAYVDFIQTRFQCCGLNSPDDWIAYNLQYCTDAQGLPSSCKCGFEDLKNCADVEIPVSPMGQYTFYSWTKGCNESFYHFLNEAVVVVGAVAFALTFCQVLMVCCSFFLFMSLLSRRRQRHLIPVKPQHRSLREPVITTVTAKSLHTYTSS